ncbi:hypothetical protein PQH03_28025 [Ralstonia insidiosa]|jgi:hypothetical protein|uniref:Uncharacterized protein n=1 Tax=Ralstonia insidiosa TaxID=190721 RepID=A0A192A720_9RALS|nr:MULTISPECIES: hypothetical protein [Ralstonia]KMW44858.1 hypothetical protein AC240_23135 [Ralstonia sp. MD27]ANJ76280.1 hypothetical protein A9Y76_27125 [Ralstonia insidiosa]MBA9869525.1 hypothetical protein [Ralstonia insidiosa]MBA9913764.1 hypothetical protein [Ralstonia insidiosa]MBA9952523.1 hypothetical protein [Ralstonia insidiosa]
MSTRFPIKSVFESSTDATTPVPSQPMAGAKFDRDSRVVAFAVTAGVLFMLACFYVVLYLGYSRSIVTFASPLGVALPCAVYLSLTSRMNGETRRSQASAIALGIFGGYVGGQVLVAIFVLAWNLVGSA